jgi:hypothetical protein
VGLAIPYWMWYNTRSIEAMSLILNEFQTVMIEVEDRLLKSTAVDEATREAVMDLLSEFEDRIDTLASYSPKRSSVEWDEDY